MQDNLPVSKADCRRAGNCHAEAAAAAASEGMTQDRTARQSDLHPGEQLPEGHLKNALPPSPGIATIPVSASGRDLRDPCDPRDRQDEEIA
jgi:hypothetical protein